MQKVVDPKTGRKITVFNKYKLDGRKSCPECGRAFDENDLELLEMNGHRNCKKCGSRLEK